MGPFDVALLTPFIVITLALTLYFRLLAKLKPTSDIKLSTYLEEPSQKNLQKLGRKAPKPAKPAEPTEPQTREKIVEKECPHYVGYLTTLPKGSPFPDECFGCRKVIQCLRLEPTGVIESFYLTETETE
jgi:hypothetical protein